AEAFLRGGRLDEASSLAAQAVELGEFAKAPHFRAMGSRVQAEILGLRQRFDEALRLFDDAVATFGVHGSGLELARARFRRGALLLARGDKADVPEAEAEIARASDAFATMGALHDRAQVEPIAADTGT